MAEPLRRVTTILTVAIPADWTDERLGIALRSCIHDGGDIQVLSSAVSVAVVARKSETPAPTSDDTTDAVFEVIDQANLYSCIAGVARAALENGCQEHPATLVRDLARAFIGKDDADGRA